MGEQYIFLSYELLTKLRIREASKKNNISYRETRKCVACWFNLDWPFSRYRWIVRLRRVTRWIIRIRQIIRLILKMERF